MPAARLASSAGASGNVPTKKRAGKNLSTAPSEVDAQSTVASQSQKGSEEAGAAFEQPSLIKVFPRVVDFKNVKGGITYVATVVVQNTDSKPRRLRFKAPKSTDFQLHYEPHPAIAPGLEEVVEVSFTLSEEKDSHDELIVICEDDQLTLPLHAYIPRPELEFDGFVNMGVLAKASRFIASVAVKNIGAIGGDFRFEPDVAVQTLTVTPSAFKLASGEGTVVKVEFLAAEIGVFRSLVSLSVDDKPTPSVRSERAQSHALPHTCVGCTTPVFRCSM